MLCGSRTKALQWFCQSSFSYSMLGFSFFVLLPWCKVESSSCLFFSFASTIDWKAGQTSPHKHCVQIKSHIFLLHCIHAFAPMATEGEDILGTQKCTSQVSSLPVLAPQEAGEISCTSEVSSSPKTCGLSLTHRTGQSSTNACTSVMLLPRATICCIRSGCA